MKISTIVKALLAAILGIGLVVALFALNGISFKSAIDLFGRMDWLAFLGITITTFIYIALGAYKWHLIANVREPKKFFYLHYTAQAMLLGQFLPVPVAIAVNRAAVMKLKQSTTLKKGLLNAVYDMGFDFFIAAIIIPASLLQLFYGLHFLHWLAASFFIIGLASVVLMAAPKILPKRWLSQAWLAEERKRGLLSSRLIGLMTLLSTGRLVILITRLMLTILALKTAIPLSVMAYATPPAIMSALLAITPANLGIAEWSWTYLLTLWGIPASIGAVYALTSRILIFFAQMIVTAGCWALYIAGNRR